MPLVGYSFSLKSWRFSVGLGNHFQPKLPLLAPSLLLQMLRLMGKHLKVFLSPAFTNQATLPEEEVKFPIGAPHTFALLLYKWIHLLVADVRIKSASVAAQLSNLCCCIRPRPCWFASAPSEKQSSDMANKSCSQSTKLGKMGWAPHLIRGTWAPEWDSHIKDHISDQMCSKLATGTRWTPDRLSLKKRESTDQGSSVLTPPAVGSIWSWEQSAVPFAHF